MRVGKFRLLATLRGQIVVIYTLLFLIAFFFVNLSLTRMVGEFLISQLTATQAQQVGEAATQFGAATANRDAADLYALCARNADDFSGRVVVMDMEGIVLGDSHSVLNGRILRHPEVEDILSGNFNASQGFHKVDTAKGSDRGFFARKDWAVYYTASIVHQSRSVGVLLVSLSVQSVVDLIFAAAARSTFVVLGILAILVVASVIVARFISLPIAQMTDAIERMRKGEFGARANVRGSSEIAQMARTFNDMSEQIENVEHQRQEFVANASHELKTPLSAIKILTESLLYQQGVEEATYKEFLADIDQQIDRLNSLLGDLLILAQSERSATAMRYTTESVDELIDECVKTLMPLAAEKDIAINLSDARVEMRCDRIKLSTALMNLLSNAIKFTPAGGSVSTRVEADGTWVTIEISDTGIGIPDEDRAHIFERFYRVDKARARGTGGTGLGLAIVQQVVRLHGGEITLAAKRRPGTTFIVRLPQWGVGAP